MSTPLLKDKKHNAQPEIFKIICLLFPIEPARHQRSNYDLGLIDCAYIYIGGGIYSFFFLKGRISKRLFPRIAESISLLSLLVYYSTRLFVPLLNIYFFFFPLSDNMYNDHRLILIYVRRHTHTKTRVCAFEKLNDL